MTSKTSGRPNPPSPISFNHALIYVSDLVRSLHFYVDLLGFDLLEQFPPDYARLQSSSNETTIALHLRPGDGSRYLSDIMLFFETNRLETACVKLKTAGVTFTQEPKVMPWGWKHAYLLDPDGHEISLYWAGVKRLRGH